MDASREEERYTYADYCTWPDDERWELINGFAYAKAAPSVEHQSTLLELAGQLRDFLKGRPCKVFVAPLAVRLNADAEDDSIVEPDILVVCDKSKIEDGKCVIGAPDLVIEVLSPSKAKHDKVIKRKLYQRAGVREYWVVDPDDKILMVNILRDGKYLGVLYFEDDSAVPVSVLDGCTINLVDVFEGL